MAEGFNLARRLSARNEPDLLQEDFASGGEDKTYTQQYCNSLIKNVCPSSPLPNECKKYPEVLSSLARRNSDRNDQNIAFAGMSPGERANATAAREKGHLSHAQFKRRMTSANNRHTTWW